MTQSIIGSATILGQKFLVGTILVFSKKNIWKKTREFFEKYGEEIPFPNGESLLDAKKRAINFFEQINQTYKNKKIFLVTHGYIVKTLLFYIYKDFDWEKYLKEYNNARKVFEINRP